MSSIFGKLFSVSTWGESHGMAVGVVVDGCPAGLEINAEMIQRDLDRRRPGQNELVTPRNESDTVEILSGVFDGKTTGTPISLVVFNKDQRSGDYSEIKKWYRPGHADLAYDLKYGFRDYRGGGRSSARETIARVAAGSIARALLSRVCGTEILSWVSSVGSVESKVDARRVTLEMIEKSPVRCPDATASEAMESLLREVKAAKDSVGGVLSLCVRRPPRSVGEPVFDRASALLAMGMFSIPAVKGFEIGEGFAAAKMHGSEHNDEIFYEDSHFGTRTNHAGGIYGGITSGADIFCRIAFKPTATIGIEQKTASAEGENGTFTAKGRHDPCVALRAPVIVESMAALVLADLFLEQRARSSLF
ncbi:MAG: chorismate synthase [Fibrobacter sp.]|jgi:chorismate synthase|nr:chorismate synthase [Fibrobacter sp.]